MSWRLYHFPFDPHSRLARLALLEHRVAFDETTVKYWEPMDALIALNPSGFLPVLIENNEAGNIIIAENRAILEYLNERDPDKLWPKDVTERAEARRLVSWFERKFDFDVNALILYEKMEKRLFGRGAPDMNAIRSGREALKDHLRYFDGLLEGRNWLAGKTLSYADLACAAHISVLDYFDEIYWARFGHLKTWYMGLKSRPCFRPLLAEALAGIPPASHYKHLDF